MWIVPLRRQHRPRLCRSGRTASNETRCCCSDVSLGRGVVREPAVATTRAQASGRDRTVEALLVGVALLLAAFVAVGGYGIASGALGAGEHTVTVYAERPPVQIEDAPTFSAESLSADPKDSWITNGGTTFNQRYSPLDEIDTSNVKDLKGIWRTHLRGSGIPAKYSQEAQPIVYKGVIYVPTGEDDVFAVNAANGQILWEYKAHLDQSISVVCCGWLSRGVALGEGKVYLGQLDGNLVALDQQTGKVAWKTLVAPWQQGYSITNAPLYFDGMVITGLSGGEFGIRGRVTAFDAKTGKERWRFYTTAGPNQVGNASWPAGTDAYKHGGAPVWQTPAVDPDLGLLYFSTGNAGPDNNGSKRAGKNLFTASIVAVNVKTGKLRWAYQMVHHDIWDYDAPSPTVLFDAKVNGKDVHGIGEAEKTGWLYLLNREMGKALLPIPERNVPQNADQKTWPTQPIPSYKSFVPVVISQEQ